MTNFLLIVQFLSPELPYELFKLIHTSLVRNKKEKRKHTLCHTFRNYRNWNSQLEKVLENKDIPRKYSSSFSETHIYWQLNMIRYTFSDVNLENGCKLYNVALQIDLNSEGNDL